jgi:cytochrome c-type biogenesis protein CcmH/NrfF
MNNPLPCPQCGSESPGNSLFCIECGEKLSQAEKKTKGTQRKCKSCGHFNELDALFCVACGEEIAQVRKEVFRNPSRNPSYKTIGLVIGMVFLIALVVKLGINFSREGGRARESSSPVSVSVSPSLAKVDEVQVIAVAKNFKCACGGCGELPLATCECDMPKGAVEEKNFIREKLAEGLSAEQVIELVDNRYGHRA